MRPVTVMKRAFSGLPALLNATKNPKSCVRFLSIMSNSWDKPYECVHMHELRDRLSEHVRAANISAKPDVRQPKVDQTSLKPRHMWESYARCILPVADEPSVRLAYLSSTGHVRFGRVLEDLDTFAVWIAYQHNQGFENLGREPVHHPMSLVTACVDEIDLSENIKISPKSNIIFSGHVSWVGRTSLEVTMNLRQENSDEELLQAKFVMVAKQPFADATTPVHPLHLESAYDKEMFSLAEERKIWRQEDAKTSLIKMAPSQEERLLLHELFLKTIDEKLHTFQKRTPPDGYIWMEDCKLKNVLICYPQNKNLYEKIFGGFLMRQAFELAWANSAVFCGQRPRPLSVDDIMFRRSVNIGDLLFLSSQVCYVDRASGWMQVLVHAERSHWSTLHLPRETTNTFHFTFGLDGTGDSGTGSNETKLVMPRSYAGFWGLRVVIGFGPVLKQPS